MPLFLCKNRIEYLIILQKGKKPLASLRDQCYADKEVRSKHHNKQAESEG
jgi:hypothetical protein